MMLQKFCHTVLSLQLSWGHLPSSAAGAGALPFCISWTVPNSLVARGSVSLPPAVPFALLNAVLCNNYFATSWGKSWGITAAEPPAVFTQEGRGDGEEPSRLAHFCRMREACWQRLPLPPLREFRSVLHSIMQNITTDKQIAGVLLAFTKAIFVLFIFSFIKGALLTYLSAI